MNKAIEKLMNDYPGRVHFTTTEIKKAASDIGENPRSAYTFVKYREKCPVVSRGTYDLSMLMPKSAKTKKDPEMSFSTAVASVSNDEVYVPAFDDTFVAWGNFTELLKIVRSRMFYPTFVSGLSGNGKTFMIPLIYKTSLIFM